MPSGSNVVNRNPPKSPPSVFATDCYFVKICFNVDDRVAMAFRKVFVTSVFVYNVVIMYFGTYSGRRDKNTEFFRKRKGEKENLSFEKESAL